MANTLGLLIVYYCIFQEYTGSHLGSFVFEISKSSIQTSQTHELIMMNE